jgi:hypothetical protein
MDEWRIDAGTAIGFLLCMHNTKPVTIQHPYSVIIRINPVPSAVTPFGCGSAGSAGSAALGYPRLEFRFGPAPL